MSARTALRSATAAEHERVDALFGGYDLGSEAGYRRFLRAQAAAFLPMEATIDRSDVRALLPDWGERRRGRLLLQDLAALGENVPAPVEAPELTTSEALLGAVYVLEGSRLGGGVLRKALPPHLPHAFIGAPHSSSRWRILLDNLERHLYRNDLVERAVESARAVFARFEAAGLRHRGAGEA